jgi:hypothetical protein
MLQNVPSTLEYGQLTATTALLAGHTAWPGNTPDHAHDSQHAQLAVQHDCCVYCACHSLANLCLRHSINVAYYDHWTVALEI